MLKGFGKGVVKDIKITLDISRRVGCKRRQRLREIRGEGRVVKIPVRTVFVGSRK